MNVVLPFERSWKHPHMSLARYRYFEKVARLGSIRDAAEVLHVAPSAISRQIVQLEREYDAELFERQARGMQLTAAGQIVLETARALLEGLDHARSGLDDLKGLRRGHIRVWTVEGMVQDFLYPALAEFSKDYPAISYEVLVQSSDQVIERVLDDEADVGIAFNPSHDKSIVVVSEVLDPLVLIAATSHEASLQASIMLPSLNQWKLALPDLTFGMRHLIDEACARTKTQLRPVLVTNSVESLRSFARSGMGVSILTSVAVRQDVEAGRLTTVSIKDAKLGRAGAKICVRRDRKLSPGASALVDRLKAKAKGFGYSNQRHRGLTRS